MKKINLICLLLSVCLLLGLPMMAAANPEETTSPPQETEPTTQPQETEPTAGAADMSVTNGCRTFDAQVPLFTQAKEPLSAQSAMLYEVNSGTVVYAHNPDERISPASLVKIMTLLLAVEQGNFGDVITVTRSALDSLPIGAMTVRLQAGEQLTLEQLLHCMMVGSGNDAAAVVAEHLAGSQKSFVAQMNARAAELGCTRTNFMNPHGLHDDNQYTTARDMCRILAAAMENGTFMTFFGTTEYTVPATNLSEERHMTTTNYLMSAKSTLYDKRVTGGRTGTNSSDGRCLAVTAAGDGISYAAVVLSAKPEFDPVSGSIIRYGNYEDARLLLNLGLDHMQLTQVLSQSQVLGQYPVENARNHVAVGTNRDVRVALPSDISMSDFTVRYGSDTSHLTAPIEAGQIVTDFQLWLGETCVAQADLVARNAVPVASNILVDRWTKETQGPDLLMMAIVFLVVAAVLLFSLGILYVFRKVRLSIKKSHSRRRRRDRRRSK